MFRRTDNSKNMFQKKYRFVLVFGEVEKEEKESIFFCHFIWVSKPKTKQKI
jgi:hypothetical protein